MTTSGIADKLSVTKRRMKAIAKKHDDLPSGVISSLPRLLSDPDVVYNRKAGREPTVLVEVLTAAGEPIVVGFENGRLSTITPRHHTGDKTGQDRMANELTSGEVLYARNKEALDKHQGLQAAADAPQLRYEPMARGQGRNKRIVMAADLVNETGREPGRTLFARRPQMTSQGELPGTEGRHGGSQQAGQIRIQEPIAFEGGELPDPAWMAPEMTRFDNVVYRLQNKHVDMKRALEPIRPDVR